MLLGMAGPYGRERVQDHCENQHPATAWPPEPTTFNVFSCLQGCVLSPRLKHQQLGQDMLFSFEIPKQAILVLCTG